MPAHIAKFKPKKHLCPVHGVTEEIFKVTLTQKEPKIDEVYCLRCARDVLRRFISPLSPVIMSVETPEEEKHGT